MKKISVVSAETAWKCLKGNFNSVDDVYNLLGTFLFAFKINALGVRW